MKDAPFLLALVGAFFVKSSVSEVGLGNMATSPKISQRFDRVPNAEAARAESQGAKQRDLLQTTSQLGGSFGISAREIEGTWVGFANPFSVSVDASVQLAGHLICPAEFQRRGHCLSDQQLTLEIGGGGFVFREGPTSCDSCGVAVGTESVSGTVTAFRNNRLEVRYLFRDHLINGMTQPFGEGLTDACMNMEVFVEDGRVLADFRTQVEHEGDAARVLVDIAGDGFSKCTSKPITCEIDTDDISFWRLRAPQESLMQCVSGKCLQLAGENGVIPTSLNPCDLGLPSSKFGPNPRRSQLLNRSPILSESQFMNGSQSNLTATWLVAFVAFVVSCYLLTC